MTREVGRRFLVARRPADPGTGKPIRQAYVAIDGGAQVRVREAGDARALTVKGGTGRDRVEVERESDGDDFAGRWDLTEGRRVVKRRAVLPLGDLRIEVDVFEDDLDRLTIGRSGSPRPRRPRPSYHRPGSARS